MQTKYRRTLGGRTERLGYIERCFFQTNQSTDLSRNKQNFENKESFLFLLLGFYFQFVIFWEFHRVLYSQYLAFFPSNSSCDPNSFLNSYLFFYYHYACMTYWVHLVLFECTCVQEWQLGLDNPLGSSLMHKTESSSLCNQWLPLVDILLSQPLLWFIGFTAR